MSGGTLVGSGSVERYEGMITDEWPFRVETVSEPI